jgi:predicted nucleic acid-binding protein
VRALLYVNVLLALFDSEHAHHDVSVFDAALFHHDRILGPRQLTDVYLLGLAMKHGGRLATLDQAIPAGAVRGAEARHVAFI